MLFNSDDRRVNGRGGTPIIARTLLASALLLGVTTAINAQPNLVLTQAYAGNFNPFGDGVTCSSTSCPKPEPIGCTYFSPQFQNLPTNPFDPAFFYRSRRLQEHDRRMVGEHRLESDGWLAS